MKLKIGIVSVLVCCPGLAWAQGTFENLDFEAANFVPLPSFGLLSVKNGLPDWSASIDGAAAAGVLLNTYSPGQPSIDIFDSLLRPSEDPGVIAGDYTVCLQAYNADQGNVSIWQTGTLPANAVSLEFRAWNYPSANGDFSVSFANNNLSPVAIGSGQSSTGQDYTDYSANIQPYAGQTGALEFTAIGGNGANWLELDDINFSSTTPEPGTAVLTCLGGMVFWMYRRFRRN